MRIKYMRYILSIVLVLFFYHSRVRAQDKMIVDEKGNVSTFYDASKDLKSLDNLPYQIKRCLDTVLTHSLGNLRHSLIFVNIQVVDLESYFKTNDPSGFQWIVPKYEFHYYIHDLELGIKRYNLNIRLDQYGQFLAMNWPRNGSSETEELIDRKIIRKYALAQATAMGLDTIKYQVEFNYDEKSNKMCWQFNFPDANSKDNSSFISLLIPWDRLQVAEKFNLRRTVNY